MEESELMKERLQAITEKHRIQEVIRLKKQELDQEKLKLKHLKKKSLREQWLLDSSSHNRPGSSFSSEQQTRSLLLTIYRMEKEIEALEREEAIVSKNESFILEQLRVVEKSTQDIIKEAHDTFVPGKSSSLLQPGPTGDPLTFAKTVLALCVPSSCHHALFAMEINVKKNMCTGESSVLSTSCVHPEDLLTLPGLKVYNDGRKCVYALHSLEDNQSGASELSASEVEQLLKSATVHRQRNQHHPGPICCCNHQPHQQHHLHSLYNGCSTHQGEEEEVCWRASDHHRNRHNHKRSGPEIQRGTSFKLPHNNHHFTSHQLRRHQSFHSNGPSSHSNHINNHPNSFSCQNNCANGFSSQNNRGKGFGSQNNRTNGFGSQNNHANGFSSQNNTANSFSSQNNTANSTNGFTRFPSSPHSGELEMSAQQPCYTPGSDIPLSHYINVDEEEELVLYRSDRKSPAPSPLFAEDTPFTILTAMESGEPVTAVFMGFQPAQDDSGRGREFEGTLEAELVVIDDDYGKEEEEEETKQEAAIAVDLSGTERCPRVRAGAGLRKYCCTLS